MSAAQFSQLWQLAKIIAFPVRFSPWIVIGVAVCVIVALDSVGVAALGSLFLFLGVLILALWFFLVCLLMPSQMVSLASSRQLSLLGDIKRKLLCIYMSFIVFFSGLITLIVSHKIKAVLEPSVFCIIFIFTVALTGFALWAAIKKPGLQNLIYILMPFYIGGAQKLQSLPLGYLIVFTVCALLLFSMAWLRWVPEKYQANMFCLSPQEWQKLYTWQLPWRSIRQLFFGKATLFSQLLWGTSDVWWREILRYLLGIIWLPLGLYFVVEVSGSHMPTLFFGPPASIWMLIMISVVGIASIESIYRGLKKIWLIYPYSRAQLFNYLEWVFFRRQIACALIALSIWLLTAWCFGYTFNNLPLLLWLALSGITFGMMTFYQFLIFYVKAEQEKGRIYARSGGYVVMMITLGVNAFTWQNDHGGNVFTALGIYALLFSLCIYSRFSARKLMQKVYFMQVRR